MIKRSQMGGEVWLFFILSQPQVGDILGMGESMALVGRANRSVCMASLVSPARPNGLCLCAGLPG